MSFWSDAIDYLLDATGIWKRIAGKVNVQDGWGITKNFYSVLGLIAAESARVEELLGILATLLFELEAPIGSVLLANLGFQSRMDVIQSLIGWTDKMAEERQTPELLALQVKSERIRKVLAQIAETFPKRNFYIHGFYTERSGEDDAYLFSVRVKGKLTIHNRIVTVDEMYKTYLGIHDARVALAVLVREYDTKEVYHDQEHGGGVLQGSVEIPSPDPMSPPHRQDAHMPLRAKAPKFRKLSSAQKRKAREQGVP